jgi:hypothetical protein
VLPGVVIIGGCGGGHRQRRLNSWGLSIGKEGWILGGSSESRKPFDMARSRRVWDKHLFKG